MRRLNLICLGTTLWLVLAASSALAQPPYWSQMWGSSEPVNSPIFEPRGIYMEDLDSDGDLDMVVHNGITGITGAYTPEGLYFIENLGDFSFSQYPEFLQEYAIDIPRFEDLDQDGFLDLILGEDRIFPHISAYDFDNYVELPYNVKDVADINQDGWPDLIAVQDGALVTANNLGDGTFGDPVQISAEGVTVGTVVAGDLNLDGHPDLVASWSGKIWWWANNGSGGYGGGNTVETINGSAVSLTLADLDHDGDLDVISGTNGDEVLSMHANNIGSYSAPQPLGLPDLSNSHLLEPVDLDGDGDTDLLVTDRWGDDAIWIENLGDGTQAPPLVIHSSADPTHYATVDVDGDGDLDLIRGHDFTRDVSIIKHDDDHTFQDIEFLFGATHRQGQFYVEDINQDGQLEYIQVHRGHFNNVGRISWFQPNANGNWGLGHDVVFADGINSMEVGDLNGDGLLDMVFCAQGSSSSVPNPTPNMVGWAANEGGGLFGEIQTVALSDTWEQAELYWLGDIDNDADADLLIRNAGNLLLLLNDGNGNFTESNLNTPYYLEATVADFNSDGQLDIAAVDADKYTLATSLGNGDGTFAEPVVGVETGLPIRQVVAFELQGNPGTDLGLVLQESLYWDDAFLATVDGLNDGTFSALDYRYFTAAGIQWFGVHDLLGNGTPDLLLHQGEQFHVRHLNADGSLASEKFYGVHLFNAYSPSYRFADFDGDGSEDRFSGNFWRNYWAPGVYHQGCTDPEACNYNSTFTEDDGSCCYEGCGCTQSSAQNYDPEATCDDNSCVYSQGCTQSAASNYDPTAQQDDGSCILVSGCTDEIAENYAPEAVVEDGSCMYILGCMDPIAENYNPEATMEDGLCEYIYGCMDPIAENFNPDATMEDGSCTYVSGCTDPIAENYNPEAVVEDGSCMYILGCMDPIAENYNPDATQNDGTCEYIPGCTDDDAENFDPEATEYDGSCMYLFKGVVFDDLTPNGIRTSDEPGLAFRTVEVVDQGITLITNDFGEFEVLLPLGTHGFSVLADDVYPFVTTIDPFMISSSSWSIDDIKLGLSKDAPVYSVCIDFYPSGNGGLCDTWLNFNICYRNMSNTNIDGVIEVEYDPLYQGYQEVTPIDSVVDNRIYMSFQDLPPGSMYFYDFKLKTPTVDFIGEFLESVTSIWGYNMDGDQVASGEATLTSEVTCAYDPNDKQAFPLGYGEDHLLLGDTEQEFLVRFQNTGNAPAQDVVIRDTLDTHFDIDSFELVANSHSVMTVINENTREVVFTFADIQLPDSTCCEQDSHGLVSYRIRPLPGLEAGTRLENTAYIYFDNNPPIVTNTTWTTIHECGQALEYDYELQPECPFWLPAVHSTYQEVTGLPSDHYWTADGDLSSQSDALLLPLYYEGNIQLTISNPLCVETGNVDWEPVLDLQWFTCPGDLDCDEYIDAIDLLAVLGNYGCTLPECTFELTGDGQVNADDLLMILGAFGLQCE